MRQAASVSTLQQLDAFGKAFAEPCNVALFVDFFAAAFEATSISFTAFLPTPFWRAALKTPPQPRNSRLMQEHILHTARLPAGVVPHESDKAVILNTLLPC